VDCHFHSLQPWKHYVPIQYDLSDLEEKDQWALDPNNEALVLHVVDAANAWCRTRQVYGSLVENVLDIWDAYVREWDLSDPLWLIRWKDKNKEEMFAAEFGMVRVY